MLGNLFRRNPVNKLKAKHEKLLFEAMQAQRNGDIRKYSFLTTEAEALLVEIEKLQTASDA